MQSIFPTDPWLTVPLKTKGKWHRSISAKYKHQQSPRALWEKQSARALHPARKARSQNSSPSPLGPRRLRLRADPIRLEPREIESRTFRPLSRLLAFLPELPLLHQHVTVAAPWRPEGVPPTGVCRKAPATTSPGRVPALRAAHGRSPGGTEPARLGARRVCSWRAGPRCPSPSTPPQSAPRRKADRGRQPGLRLEPLSV